MRIEDTQDIVESEEEIQIETDQEDELAEEDDTSKPMMTRRGRIIRMPARFLFMTMIGIVLQTVSSTDDTSNMTIANEEIIECFNIEEMLYGLSIYLPPFIFIIIMMIIFVVINRSISIFTRHFKCNPTYEMIDLNINDEEILHEDEQVIQENLTDDVTVNVICHEVQGQHKVECLDTSFTAATQTRQSESVYNASLKHDNAIYPKVTNQSPRLTGTRKGKLNVETSPGGLDLNQTLVSDEHKGHISSSGGKLEKRNQEQETKQVNKNKQNYKKPPIIILLLCI